MLMKKFLSLFLCLTCVLTLVACGKKVAPITLPQTDEITSIDITFGENTVSHSDKTWISEIIADISSSEPTKKESVQDCPQVESYIKIDFQFETGTSTIFAYEDSGKYYIEQPYQGIYKIDSQRGPLQGAAPAPAFCPGAFEAGTETGSPQSSGP